MKAAFCGVGAALWQGARRVLPGDQCNEVDKLTRELDQIDAVLRDVDSRKRLAGEDGSPSVKRPCLQRCVYFLTFG